MRYIPSIKHAYTFHMTIYSIYLTYTYSKLFETFRYLSRDSLDIVYTRAKYIPSHVTGTEMSQKVLSRCMLGIYCISSYERYMHGIYQVYTWYILSMISYDWYMIVFMFVFRISWAASQSPRPRPTGHSGRRSSGPRRPGRLRIAGSASID